MKYFKCCNSKSYFLIPPKTQSNSVNPFKVKKFWQSGERKPIKGQRVMASA